MTQESKMHHRDDVYPRFRLGSWPAGWAGGCLVAALFVAAAGCGTKGPDVQFVEGRVTLDGQPLGNATIGLTCTDTAGIPPAFGLTDENGVYRLTSIGGKHQRGACVGTFVVTVSKFETEKSETSEDGAPVGGPPKAIRIVPEIYGDTATSLLRATIHKGENKGPDYDFALEARPAKKP
jgi:hypothetical protein